VNGPRDRVHASCGGVENRGDERREIGKVRRGIVDGRDQRIDSASLYASRIGGDITLLNGVLVARAH
jgi:hypothetical protein